MASMRTSARATRARTLGSEAAGRPFFFDFFASVRISSRWRCSPATSAMLERSWARAETVTFQPCPSAPSRFATGTRTLSKNTSAKIWPPAMFLIGRTVIPGVSISTSRQVMPSCLSEPASVRTSRMIHFDHIAIEVQIFWPFTTYSSPSRTAREESAARSLPEPGSE
jgi:hypothetical protein